MTRLSHHSSVLSTWTLLTAATTMMMTTDAWTSSSSSFQHDSQRWLYSPLSLSENRSRCLQPIFSLKISGSRFNYCNSSVRSQRTSSSMISVLAAAGDYSEDLSDDDDDDNDTQRRVLLPPRRVKIRARAKIAPAATTTTTTNSASKKGNNDNNISSSGSSGGKSKSSSSSSLSNTQSTFQSSILDNNLNQWNESTTPSSSSSSSSSSTTTTTTPFTITSRTKSGAPYQHQEMLDHTLLSREEELLLGRQVVRARMLREKMEEVLIEKKMKQQQRRKRRSRSFEESDNVSELEDDDYHDDDNDLEDDCHPRSDLDYNFLSYELEFLSVYGYRRGSKDSSLSAATSARKNNELGSRDNFEKKESSNNDKDDDNDDDRLLGGYDLDDDLLFEHAMHRSEHYSQLSRLRGSGVSSGSSRNGINDSNLDDVDSGRQQQKFGRKRTGYRNGSTSSTNRNSYSSLLNIPLHKLDDSDVRILLESINMDGVEPGEVRADGGNGRVVLVNILLDGAFARETLMRRNVKLVMSIAKNWMRNSFTTANSNNNNIPGDGGGGGVGSGSGSSGKRNDKSTKRYLAQMYEGSWDKPSLDEAVQEGMLGLARAVDKFDPERGLRFSTYATHWVTSYVRVCFQRAVTGCLRVPSQLHDIRAAYNQIVKDHLQLGSTPPAQESIAQQLNISEQRLHIAIRATGTLLSVDAPLMSGGSSANYKGSMAGGDGRNSQELMLLDTLKCAEPRPEDQVEISFLRQCLENAMATELTPYERDILRLRLGLDSGEGKSVREIVDLSGGIVSMADVRSAERRAFKKLRSPSSVHTHNLLAYLDLASIQGGRG